MTKDVIIKRAALITAEANSHNNSFHYELKINNWDKNGKSRTYISIVRTRDCSTHYKKKNYGYFDNVANEYVCERGSGRLSGDVYDFGENNILIKNEA